MSEKLPSRSRTESQAGQSLHEAGTTAGPPVSQSDPVSMPPSLASHPRYRLLELLGAGGMGAVYKAEHRRMERQVALKVMSPHLMDRPEMVERFHREVKAAALLTHPNIVTAYDADQAGDAHFLIMEFVEGVNLAEKVQREGPLPIAPACAYIRQAALGLQHAFERGMVHRDVKPHNLMLTPSGRVKILDFGLARFVREMTLTHSESESPAREKTDPAETMASPLTETGTVLGTVDFIAPEQASNPSVADIRADIYSLGCTLYYLLTGHAPFPEGTARDKLIAHCEREPAPLTELRRDVPPALARVVERMVAKEASQRYQAPAEVAEALSPFLPDTPPSHRGRRHFAVIAAVCALVLLLGSITYLLLPPNPFSFPQGPKQGRQVVESGLVPGEIAAEPKRVRPRRSPITGEGVPQKYRESINKGLAYLAQMQKSDGHWEVSGGQYPTSITALAGMAMLMEGSTLADGKYANSLRKTVDWLMQRCQPNGLLSDPKNQGDKSRYMFGHGFSMMFLATVYGQEEDGDLRQKLETILNRATEFTLHAQTRSGGWGYVAAREGKDFDEGACTIVQLQGLRAARNAGIEVPKRLIDIDYLRKCTGPNGGIIYSLSMNQAGGRPALTAGALACMFTVGETDSTLARTWLQFCRKNISLDNPARPIGHDAYTHYYLAQALYILGDKGYEKLFPESKPAERLTWTKYRNVKFDYLLSCQAEDGSWNTGVSGPILSTICTLTILQLDDATLPIYRR